MPSLKNLVTLIASGSLALGASAHPQAFRRAEDGGEAPPDSETCDYTVKAGYHAQSIGEMFGTDRDGILALNPELVTEDGGFPLSPGDVLKVPCVEPKEGFEPDVSGPCLKTKVLTEEDLAGIEEGDNCFDLARRLAVGVANFQAWNPDLPTFQDKCQDAAPGQEVCVAHFEEPPCAKRQEVKQGDNQEEIAAQNNVDVPELERLNPNLLFKGFLLSGDQLCVQGE
ncbi:hypothetical protein CDD81_4893 [Ophiocordyceps australis]|uniref:LysM domain-containing protein n=1 Tax=Ophiocordyceps australis TaxID=1399860 RepID=A0A2C5Y8V4_9HYPO|nr:hypothetical protein CDD81_4893 [Ophiocordyceps australis]